LAFSQAIWRMLRLNKASETIAGRHVTHDEPYALDRLVAR